MPTPEELADQIAKLDADRAILEKKLVEDPINEITFKSAVDIVAADPLMSSIGVAVVKSEIHPQWCSLDFPVGAASGFQALAMRQMIQLMLSLGAEPGFKVVENGAKSRLPYRVYVAITNINECIEAVRVMALTDSQRVLEYAVEADEASI